MGNEATIRFGSVTSPVVFDRGTLKSTLKKELYSSERNRSIKSELHSPEENSFAFNLDFIDTDLYLFRETCETRSPREHDLQVEIITLEESIYFNLLLRKFGKTKKTVI